LAESVVFREYNLTYRQALVIWHDTHTLIEEYSDLLTKAAERIYQDKVLGPEFWEEEILLTQ